MRKATILTIVHNGERYVEETIKSVLNQSETDFWYYIRLNACTDGSEEIVRKYAAMDNRITVLKNKVNFITDDGIPSWERAFWPEFDSEFVTLVDHDDILHPEFLKTLYDPGKTTNADMVVAGYTSFDYKIGNALNEKIPPNFQIDCIEHIRPYISKLFGSIGTLWGKLYAKNLFNQYYEQIKNFPKELYLSKDTWQVFSLLEHCNRIVSIDQSLYYYRVNQVSQFFSEKPEKSRIYEGKILFDKEISVFKQIKCDTEKNVDKLYHVHRSHMLTLVDIVKKSKKMTSAEKIDYLQSILQDDHLATYRNLAMEKIQPRMQDCMKGIVEAKGENEELWQYYIYRVEYSRIHKIKTKDDLLIYLSGLLCQDNTLAYGLEMLSQTLWLQIPVLDQDEILARVRYIDKDEYPFKDTQNARQMSEDIERRLVSHMKINDWETAGHLLQELENYALASEAGILCRLMLSVNQGKAEEAKRLSYIAQALCPESQSIQKVCCQLK